MKINKNDEVLEIDLVLIPIGVRIVWQMYSQVEFGGSDVNTKGKPLFKIIDGKLPFKNKSFHYIICSQVFEHVPVNDLSLLASEIMRVAGKAYIEFPRPLYNYIYNFNVHLNLLDIVNGEIICLPKIKTHLNVLKRFQDYSLNLRHRNLFAAEKCHTSLMAIGKEFHEQIPLKLVESEEEFWNIIWQNDFSFKESGFTWRLRKKITPNRIKRKIFGEKTTEYFQNKLSL